MQQENKKLYVKMAPKLLKDTSPKKIYRWQISMWKDVLFHMSSGEYRLKQQWATTTHLLQWPKYGTEMHQMLVRCSTNRDSHLLLVRMQNGIATLEDSLAVPYKTNKNTLSIWCHDHASWYWSKEAKNLCPHENRTWLFLAILLIINKIWKQPRCPSVVE